MAGSTHRVPDAGVAVLVALVLFVLAMVTGGATAIGPLTWTEIVLVLAALGVAARVVAVGPDGPANGRAPLIWFIGLTLLTILSILWSVAGDLTWSAASLTVSYVCAFGIAVGLARLYGDRFAAVTAGVAIAATALTLWTLLVKVFNLNIDGQPTLGRLLAPFSYWNATGLIAAMGLPAVVWVGSRRQRGAFPRAAAPAAVALLITVVVLSYSRSALAAAVLGTAVTLPFTDSRLRSLLTLVLGGAGAAVLCVWAVGQQALINDSDSIYMAHVGAGARSAAGLDLGLASLVAFVVVGALGVIAVRLADSRALPEDVHVWTDRWLVRALALVPVLIVVALLLSSRGLTGEVSHIWSSLTSTGGPGVNDTVGRLTSLANSRPKYWRQGLSVGEHHLLAGAGSGSFGVAHLRYSTALLTRTEDVQHVHSYVIEMFAGLGLLGIIVNLGLFVTWIRAAMRTAGITPIRRAIAQTRDEERAAMWALIGVTVAFGASSTIDWTWSFPGVAVPALLCAGWVAGRGPAAAMAAPVQRRPLRSRPLAIYGITCMLALTLAVCLGIWLPLHSSEQNDAAVTALAHLNGSAALSDAESAVSAEPVAVAPLQTLANVYSAFGEPGRERAELVKATSIQPENPQPWCWLGVYELARRDYRAAEGPLRHAVMLDVTNSFNQQALLAAAKAHHQPSSLQCVNAHT